MERNVIKVTQVEIIPFRPKAGHLGFASCVINNQFYIGDIAIFSRPQGGIRLGFPVKKLANGTVLDICKPLNQEVEQQVEDAVAERYERLTRPQDPMSTRELVPIAMKQIERNVMKRK